MASATSRTVTVSINGRFLGRPITGVERVATELLRGLAARVSDGGVWTSPSGGHFRFQLLVPPDVQVPAGYESFDPRTVGRRTGHLWEQLDLPRAARGTFLVNLGNTAPIVKRNQLVLLCDAGVFRTPEAYQPAFRWWYRAMYLAVTRRVTALVTISRFSQNELAACCHVQASRFTVLPLGHEHALAVAPDRAVFERCGIPSSGYVLGVSSQNSNKNFPVLLRAVELLSETADPPPVVIAGRVNPKVFGAGTPESGHAAFIGPVSDAELAALYEGAACLVYPSLYEGFGLPPIEAMARGCPVVASRAAALSETCADAAVYCDADSERSIAGAITRVLAEPALRESLREAGFRRIREHRWEQTLDTLLRLISNVRPRNERGARMSTADHLHALMGRSRHAARAAFRRSVGAFPKLYVWRMRAQQFATGSVHDPDFEIFRGCRVARAIDVGANRGQSIVSIKSVAPDAEILAFEPNVELVGPLQQIAARYTQVNVIGVGCADSVALRTLYTPVARGIAFEQWASLEPLAPAAALELIRRSGFTWCRAEDVSINADTCLFVPLDAIISASDGPIDLLKIDVEGAETEVVGGAMDLITRDRPLLLAERPDDPLIELLEGLGYEHHRSRQAQNSLFIDPQHDRGVDRRVLQEKFDRVRPALQAPQDAGA